MELLDTDSECVQCKWCDMEWSYWMQTVSVYSVNGVILNSLCLVLRPLVYIRGKKLNKSTKSEGKRNQQKHEM